MFYYFPYRIYHSDVLPSTKAFMYWQIIIHFFKMNSYFKANRNYMEAYRADKDSRISRYPENINYKDFFMFMRHPTLVYQDTYPLVKDFSLVTVFKRFIVIVFGMGLVYEIYQS